MSLYRTRSRSEVDALHWTGGDWAVLDGFCGRNWARGDAVDREYDDPEQVVAFDAVACDWVAVPVGYWIVRGIDGVLNVMTSELFDATYAPIDPDDDAFILGVGIPRDSRGRAIRLDDRVAFGDDPAAVDVLFGAVVGLGDLVVIESGVERVSRLHSQVTVVETA